jgi:CYTH domain-containing protein
VSVSLKYAVVERERRYLLSKMPDGATSRKAIVDRYVNGTRLRLREVREDDGTVVRKLGHKVRLTEGPRAVACTNAYLDEEEWAVLSALPARTLRKTRHMIPWGKRLVAVDEHEDGTLVAEIDDSDEPSDILPTWLDVVREVSDDENWTGSALAR